MVRLSVAKMISFMWVSRIVGTTAFALVLLSNTIIPKTDAVLAGAAVLPHGDFAFDPTLLPPFTPERQIAKTVAAASRQAGAWLSHHVRPDIIFLSTPHGIKLDNDFSIFMGSRGSGTVSIGNDLYNKTKSYNVSMEVDLAPDEANNLLLKLQDQHQNVSGIYSYNNDASVPLQWGEIIPLSMIPAGHEHHLIWSNPERRFKHAPEMVAELLHLGKLILAWAEGRPERIGVVISADLAHTHQTQGPYGYSNSSAPFDAAIGRWASDPCLHAASLLKTARSLQNEALCCGFTGLVLLHGMLCSSSTRFKPNVLANANVTYYGMMAATFDRGDDA
jgi:aromatic ring-opening dioxygenase LigB subunit